MSEHDDHAKRARSFIVSRWPQILPHIPQEAAYCRLRLPVGPAHGLCTHPSAIDVWWVHSRGGKRFSLADSVPPDAFFWVGIQDRGGSEYLSLIWFREGRRFWFYDQYLVYVATSEASVERTRSRIEAALGRWHGTRGDVIYSGLWGWYDTQASGFERDCDRLGECEDWESVRE